MANVIGFAVDLAVNVAVLAEVFGAQSSGPIAKVGTGSMALPGSVPPPPPIPNNEQPAGPMPAVDLYDVHGQNFATDTAFGEEMANSDNKQVNFQGGLDNSNLDSTPEYMRLIALQGDAVCISWVTVTGTDGTHTSWHAGYAQQCNVPAWYPSPDLFPSTNYRPGCVWLTNQVDFPGLQGISFKLTDLSFQSDADTNAALSQFSSNPDTLCNAPGRMAFWKTADPEDCIPFYDFVEEKDQNTGFDVDFGKIMTGQTLTCTPTGSMYTPSNFPTPSPTTTTAPPPPPPSTADGVGSFGGVLGEIPASEAGQQTTQAPPPPPQSTADGVGSFGGVLGEIPASEAGQQTTQTPPPPPPPIQTMQPPTQTFNSNAGDQGVVEVSFNRGGPTGVWEAVPPEQTAKSRRRSIDHSSILKRRATLEKRRDFCVDRLTISHLADHTATVVCQSETSWGPDFVSVIEGLYCDMCEKMLWNLCAGPGATYCFDLVARELRFSRGLGTRDLEEGSNGEKELVGLRKKYAKVDEWKE